MEIPTLEVSRARFHRVASVIFNDLFGLWKVFQTFAGILWTISSHLSIQSLGWHFLFCTELFYGKKILTSGIMGLFTAIDYFIYAPWKARWHQHIFFISNQNPHPRRKYVGIYYNFDAVFYTIPCCIETITKHHRFATVQTFLTDSQRSVSIISRSCCRTRAEHTDTHTVYMLQNNYIVIKRYACVTVLLIAKGINFTTHPYDLSYCVASSHPWYISLCNRSELTLYEYYHI